LVCGVIGYVTLLACLRVAGPGPLILPHYPLLTPRIGQSASFPHPPVRTLDDPLFPGSGSPSDSRVWYTKSYFAVFPPPRFCFLAPNFPGKLRSHKVMQVERIVPFFASQGKERSC